MYIGGKQARPDSGYSRPVYGPGGELVGEVGDGNRKDIRNAVEAARAALGWGTTAAHNRAQILFFLAENLDYRADEFAARIKAQTGKDGAEEVAPSVERLFAFAGWADKYDGAVHNPPIRADRRRHGRADRRPRHRRAAVAPAARLDRAARPGDRHGQPGGAGPVRDVAAARSPTSTR